MILSTGRNTTLVLWISASLLLNACGSTDTNKSVTISTEPEPQDEIVKSPIITENTLLLFWTIS